MSDWLTNIGVGIAAFGAGAYGMYQKVMADSRNNKAADTTDAAWQQVIATLREEVSRLSDRLAAVEEQNRKCEERNDELHQEILDLKKQLHLS
jgi:septal ring factor EnvC (AmiA/AmiB activator)